MAGSGGDACGRRTGAQDGRGRVTQGATGLAEEVDEDVPGPERVIGRVRKTRIAELVRRQGFMSPADLAQRFDVSEMTIRRDLAELAMRGEIQRIHGGAIADVPPPEEEAGRPFGGEAVRQQEAKRRIARAALRQVRPAQAVALDAGTTTLELALALGAAAIPVRLFTNNLRVAGLPMGEGAEVYLLGGRLRENERSLGGPVAVEQARRLWFDTAFLGVSSVATQGFFDSSIEEAELKRLLIERATRRIFLVDSSKFGTMALVQVAALNQCDLLVTDAPPPRPLAEAFAAAGVQVVVAED
jgi:DeoR/GlpR family transcriptional regulator of sugar metabolism